MLWAADMRSGETPYAPPYLWLPMQSFETKRECEAYIRNVFNTDPTLRLAFVLRTCLPDTVDPRGPKGK